MQTLTVRFYSGDRWFGVGYYSAGFSPRKMRGLQDYARMYRTFRIHGNVIIDTQYH